MKLYSFGESGNAYKCALALEMTVLLPLCVLAMFCPARRGAEP